LDHPSDQRQHPLRRSLWRGSHAFAGVPLILSLVAIDLVVHAALADGWEWFVRTTGPAAARLLLAFVLPIARTGSQRPNRLINPRCVDPMRWWCSSAATISAPSASRSGLSRSASGSSAPRKTDESRTAASSPN
jgi:hypothetical protein